MPSTLAANRAIPSNSIQSARRRDSSGFSRPILLAVLAAVNVGLYLLFPPAQVASKGDTLKVGLVLDIGGLGDKSFNDGAYEGLKSVRDQLSAGISLVEPGDGGDRESALRLLAAQGNQLVLGVGFMFTDDLNRVSADYPNTSFAGVDYSVSFGPDGKPLPPPPNVQALKFREEEGSFLVGAVAGLVSKSKVVGFVGGMDIPLIHKFEAGYRAGALAVCPTCKVLSAYAGVTPVAFKDPGKGKELALAQLSEGADILYHASGSTGLGVFAAVRERKALAIGVDADQYAEAPGFILTSMVKRVDRAVFEASKQVQQKQFSGGVQTLGLKEGGVDYVYDAHNQALISEEVHAQVEALRQKIISGELHVPEQ